MKFAGLLRFLSVPGVLCGLLLPAAALDREAFAFTKYDLRVQIEPSQQRLAVRGAITLRNDSSTAQKNLALQISSSLQWRSIQVSGKAVQFVSQTYTSDIDHTGALSEAIVTLPADIPPHGSVDLEIGYEGVIPLDATRLTRIGVPEDQARHTDWDEIGKSFTALRGVGYVAWYPVAIEAVSLSEGNSVFDALGRWKQREAKAEFDVKLNYSGESPEVPPRLFCNDGKVNQATYEQMGRAQLAMMECLFNPLGLTVPTLAVGRYETVERPELVIYLPEHKSSAEVYGLGADKVLPFVTGWVGTPRQKMELVELADPEAAPYESGNMLLSPLNGIDAKLAESTAVHQLTHAAFPSPRPWISEGLAHFAQALYREHDSGRQSALDFMNAQRPAFVELEKSLTADPGNKASTGQSLINTNLEELYRSKAMYVWWMLRDMVGERVLKKALAAYRPERDDQPSYVQHLIEAQAPNDLEWFFDDWVYRDGGLPDFRVASVYPRQTMLGNYMVTVTIENVGAAGAEVPVTVKAAGAETTMRLVVRGKSRNSIRIEVPSPPKEVVVNDGSVPESDLTNNVFQVEAAQAPEQK